MRSRKAFEQDPPDCARRSHAPRRYWQGRRCWPEPGDSRRLSGLCFSPCVPCWRVRNPTAPQCGNGSVETGSVWVEDKFDGIRAQIHCAGDRAEIFSRDLRNITESPFRKSLWRRVVSIGWRSLMERLSPGIPGRAMPFPRAAKAARTTRAGSLSRRSDSGGVRDFRSFASRQYLAFEKHRSPSADAFWTA